MFNVVLVLVFPTALLGPVLTESGLHLAWRQHEGTELVELALEAIKRDGG